MVTYGDWLPDLRTPLLQPAHLDGADAFVLGVDPELVQEVHREGRVALGHVGDIWMKNDEK